MRLRPFLLLSRVLLLFLVRGGSAQDSGQIIKLSRTRNFQTDKASIPIHSARSWIDFTCLA